MTGRERIEKAWALQAVDRVPFVPAVYEHKARLIGRTPSQVCRSLDLLLEALEREDEIYGPDALTVGLDVYNVEAEALGCGVRYFDGSPDVPAVEAPILGGPGELGRLGRPDPGRDGRMPLFVEAAARLQRAKGAEVMVRGAVTGPFSLACALAGTEEVLVATVEDTRFVRALLDFAARTAVDFGTAFLEKGVEPVLFDSKASPAAASPRVFREFVLPVYRDLVRPRPPRGGRADRPAHHRGGHDGDPRGAAGDRGRSASLRRGIGPGALRPEMPGRTTGPEGERRCPPRPPGHAGRDPRGGRPPARSDGGPAGPSLRVRRRGLRLRSGERPRPARSPRRVLPDLDGSPDDSFVPAGAYAGGRVVADDRSGADRARPFLRTSLSTFPASTAVVVPTPVAQTAPQAEARTRRSSHSSGTRSPIPRPRAR